MSDKVFVLAIGALISYFVTTLVSRSGMVKISESIVDQHTKVYHQDNVRTAIQAHAKECPAPDDTRKIKMAVAFLVMKNGGNPKDFGLNE
jgi:hypothetical protein